MASDTGPPEKGVRISIYLPAALARTLDELAYRQRKSRSRYLVDVLTKATKQAASGLRGEPTVPRV